MKMKHYTKAAAKTSVLLNQVYTDYEVEITEKLLTQYPHYENEIGGVFRNFVGELVLNKLESQSGHIISWINSGLKKVVMMSLDFSHDEYGRPLAEYDLEKI